MGFKDFVVFGATAVTLTSSFSVRAEDTTIGSEYIDMPGQAEEAAAAVADESLRPVYVPGYRDLPSVGLSPFAPQVSNLPAGVTPGYGAPLSAEGWRFEFSGYLQMPVVASIGHRENAYEGQKETVVHGDPVLPGRSWGYFDHTNTVPGPWSQLNFSFGNKVVKATAVIGSWSIGESQTSAGFYQPPSQLWYNDVFLTYTPDTGAVKTSVVIGAYPDRYGQMSRYTSGVYSLALMGEVKGVGTTVRVALPFVNGLTLIGEGGIKSAFNKPPLGTIAGNGNEWAFTSVGSTFVGHGHLVGDYEGKVAVGLHIFESWSHDDSIDNSVPIDRKTADPYPKDGRVGWVGADLRIDADRFGYFYGGVVSLTGEDSLSVDNLATALYSGGGKDFSERYWGMASNGNGGLTYAGLQYTLSLGTLLRYPREFYNDGPDILVSAFGLYAHQTSRTESFDDKSMYKWGGEATYSLLPWLAASLRMDSVVPDTDDGDRSFWVLSPKIIFRSDWDTRESLVLQYAHYGLGDGVKVEGDRRVNNLPSGDPDSHMVALYGTMWW